MVEEDLSDDELLASIFANPPRLAPLRVAWQREQVLGMPWYAALTITPSSPDDAFSELALPDDHGTRALLGLRLERGHEREVVVDVRPQASFLDHARHRCFDLDFGGSRRTLVDLGELLPTGMSPGVYQATVTYTGGPAAEQEAQSDPMEVLLLAPSTEQLAWIRALGPLVGEHESWAAAAEAVAASTDANLPHTDPLAWPLFRARAARDPDFASWDADEFARWPVAIEPHVRVLYLRWLLANGRRGEAEVEAQNLAFRCAGLAHEIVALGLPSSA